jgi:hypothetical protein
MWRFALIQQGPANSKNDGLEFAYGHGLGPWARILRGIARPRAMATLRSGTSQRRGSCVPGSMVKGFVAHSGFAIVIDSLPLRLDSRARTSRLQQVGST